ncbi:MAG: nitrogenase component I subunit alpha [Candidatus Methanoplasma sp.]|jgi:nitrogenase molybdenum-iron protein alpha chain|nr:nitrogenase component I subunit alpha [Candidatus Methanoplasma sp.]
MPVTDKILEKYDPKVYKNRKEHMTVIDPSESEKPISANTRAIPGIMTHRGCCYAGCKGVVLGPLKDTLVITHGPIGCGFYSWGTRRNKARDPEGSWTQYCFSTDMQESDIVFGGDKKLKTAVAEAMSTFEKKPKSIMICSTCPIGLIGDDIHSIATQIEAEYGIPCMAFSCEGYKGVSQSGGHHIANNQLMRRVIGADATSPAPPKISVNLLGEYNIGGDGWETERILRKCGIEVVSIFTGDGSYENIARSHTATLNLVQCHRSINYIAEMMKTRYGIDWLKVNFIGVASTAESLRCVARYFGDPKLSERVEQVIAEETAAIADDMARFRTVLEGKTAAIYSGGSRSHHYRKLLEELGVKTIMAGYEFAHRDDYEGRKVIPTIKDDADNKNIGSITVEPDPEHFRSFLDADRRRELEAEGVITEDYAGMMPDMTDGLIVDDLNEAEADMIMRTLKPDMFFSGIKDKYIIEKHGIYSKQIHSYDYSGPYAGYAGAYNFGRDLVMGMTIPAWRLVTPKWRTKTVLEGAVCEGGRN